MVTHTHPTGQTTGITNDSITILAPRAKWDRIKKAIKTGNELILRPVEGAGAFMAINVFSEKWKDGKEHIVLFNFCWNPRPPQEMGLKGKKLTLVFNGKEFQSTVKNIVLQTPPAPPTQTEVL